MTEKQQDKVLMRLKNNPFKNFGWREIKIIHGGALEIEEIKTRYNKAYKLISGEGVVQFYFEGRNIVFIG